MKGWLGLGRIIVTLAIFTGSVLGAEAKNWWQKRNAQTDLFYPHRAHFSVMDKMGDPCLMCHSFAKNDVHNPGQHQRLNEIANEALEAICHSCHVERQSAPSRCSVCHGDVRKIWPDDHNYDYVHSHATSSQLDADACKSCHLSNGFCADCHFARKVTKRAVHALGFVGIHGFEARFDPASCAACHEQRYCRDCHRNRR